MSNITLGEVFDAMEKDGYPKVQHSYNKITRYKGKWVEGYCALGQASINLDLGSGEIGGLLRSQGFAEVYDFVTKLNDNTTSKIQTIAKRARKEFVNRLDEVVRTF